MELRGEIDGQKVCDPIQQGIGRKSGITNKRAGFLNFFGTSGGNVVEIIEIILQRSAVGFPWGIDWP